jgi:hypothetical protein
MKPGDRISYPPAARYVEYVLFVRGGAPEAVVHRFPFGRGWRRVHSDPIEAALISLVQRIVERGSVGRGFGGHLNRFYSRAR